MKIYKNEIGMVPVRIGTSSMNLVTQEAFRRGLLVEILSARNSRNYIVRLSDGESEHFIKSAAAPYTTLEAAATCLDKWATKDILRKNGIFTPKGIVFSAKDSESDVLSKIKSFNYPVVLKPTKGIKGKGVLTNIRSREEFVEALRSSVHDDTREDWLVEEQVEGDEYRVLVIEDRVAAATLRVRASVVGDGVRPVRKLIQRYNKARRGNPHLRKKPVKVDVHLERVLASQGYTLDSVLSEGEKIRLTNPANFAVGGSSKQCTELLPTTVGDACVLAVASISGLFHAGLDVIVTEKGEPYVIEVNHNPGIGAQHFPAEGVGCDIAAILVDSYFPKTKDSRKHQVFFRRKPVFHPVAVGMATKVALPQVSPESKAVKIVVTGNVVGVGMRAWVALKARNLDVNGSVRNLDNGSVEVVAVAKPEVLRKLERLVRAGPQNAEVDEVDIQSWEYPVYLGFEILH